MGYNNQLNASSIYYFQIGSVLRFLYIRIQGACLSMMTYKGVGQFGLLSES